MIETMQREKDAPFTNVILILLLFTNPEFLNALQQKNEKEKCPAAVLTNSMKGRLTIPYARLKPSAGIVYPNQLCQLIKKA
jgi:hypothetical protein